MLDYINLYTNAIMKYNFIYIYIYGVRKKCPEPMNVVGEEEFAQDQ